jgi:hypothetical protein
MKNHSFLLMLMQLAVIVFKDLYIIFPAAMIGASMEVTSVFITINCSPDFSSLLPDQQAGLGTPTENRGNNST